MKTNKERGSGLIRILNLVGVSVAIFVGTMGMGNAYGLCDDEHSIQCAQPCGSQYIRFWSPCCNQRQLGCCQRECTASICVGNEGDECRTWEPEREWKPGTWNPGKICRNNYCQEDL